MKPDTAPVSAPRDVRFVPRLATPSDGGRRLLRRIAIGTAVGDFLIVIASFVGAYQIRFGMQWTTADYVVVIAVAPAIWLSIFAALRLYGTTHFAPEEEFRRLAAAVTLGTAGAIMVSYWSKASLSRTWVATTWTIAMVLEVVSRSIWRKVRTRLEARGLIALRTLIVGANAEAARLADELGTGRGYAAVGYVSDTPGASSPNGLPVVGTVRDMPEAIRTAGAQCLLVAASAVGIADMRNVASAARRAGVEMRISSRLPEVLTTRLSVHKIGDAAVISVMPPRLSGTQRALKRAFDLSGSIGLLTLTAPAAIALALVVRATSPGPALFRQTRVTRDGRRFTMFKFRTMIDGSAPTGDESAAFFKPADDARITRLGRFLRRTSLDELPQLLNVLRGEMSLVGPRPLPVEQVATNPDLLSARHDVPAGMTGWWQIQGRSDVSAAEAVRMDLFYVENWSLAYDLYILARTLGAVVRGRGAR